MKKTDSSGYFGILSTLKVFVTERGWIRFHSPRNMATTLMVESSELLEHFLPGASLSKEDLEHELGDVLHCILLTMECLKIEPELIEYKGSLHPILDFSTKLRSFMDHFSWLDESQSYRGDLKELEILLKELLAIHNRLCKELHVDPFQASSKKLDLNRKKYPIGTVDSIESYYARKKSLQKKT